jgi:hypothetical protein
VAKASKLINSVTTKVHVLRQGNDNSSEDLEIDRKDVVPGDVLLFTSAVISLSILLP